MSTENYTLPTNKLKPLSSAFSADTKGPLPQPVVIALCGSFNPIHNAHIAIYEAAKQLLEQEKTTEEPHRPFAVLGGYVSLVSDAYPKKGLHPFVEREAIAQAALRSHPDLCVDLWEGTQKEYVRTLYVLQHLEDTIREFYYNTEPSLLARLVEDGTQIRVVFACGADLFSSFFTPGVWPLKLLQSLLDRFIIVILRRAGKSADDHYVNSQEECNKRYAAPLTEIHEGVKFSIEMTKYKFFFGDFAAPDNTSSTKIRELLSSSKTPEEKQKELSLMVPNDAASLILKYYS
ncbi:nicotinamide mononucleotide adenylyltransferase [Angomonas deanei]|uniref:Cytidylyltransferase-like, putative n=1 Tax=Angomonas deanei TaxID=59799 RepID=A0A7G2CR39_9TRYP|nr:nicotinamide mononucleotide adenylyltransferase [Angomonas deanei]CAD2221607.1 Cytidylyltransferase-like, putative [Angomonas deanei]|eukprot:EPY28255.1 nicotinamide mononucleotide adenylyltransferase [Angomonas deanei]